MTNEKLRALLEEALEYIDPLACQIDQSDLIERIENVLAEPEEQVEWESGTDYEGKTFASAQVKDVAIEVNGWDRAGTRFYWRIFSTLDEEGRADTLDEAKSAAIAAARGLK